MVDQVFEALEVEGTEDRSNQEMEDSETFEGEIDMVLLTIP